MRFFRRKDLVGLILGAVIIFIIYPVMQDRIGGMRAERKATSKPTPVDTIVPKATLDTAKAITTLDKADASAGVWGKVADATTEMIATKAPDDPKKKGEKEFLVRSRAKTGDAWNDGTFYPSAKQAVAAMTDAGVKQFGDWPPN